MPEKKDDDFLGGRFDFNGDGKTDLGEQYIAYKIYEDMTKDEKEEKPSYSDRSSAWNTSERRERLKPKPIPEYMTEEEFKEREQLYKNHISGTNVATVIMCFIPCLFVFITLQVCAEYPNNSANGFMLILVFAIAWFFIRTSIQSREESIKMYEEHFRKEKEVYIKSVKQNKKDA
ncbi:MAG: hypothetical protein J6E46_12405 [Faecalicoccus sp.]|nr:hypothetical protein [Faecalicoccus sp.]